MSFTFFLFPNVRQNLVLSHKTAGQKEANDVKDLNECPNIDECTQKKKVFRIENHSVAL